MGGGEHHCIGKHKILLQLSETFSLQISIGVMSNIIVFPINLVIITLFRKSRVRKQRPSRVVLALKESEERKRKVSIRTEMYCGFQKQVRLC